MLLKKKMNNVYLFYNKDNEIIYIGKTHREIELRMNEHFNKHGHLPKKCYDDTVKIEYYSFLTAREMDIAEAYLIRKHRPKFNTKIEYLNNKDKIYIKDKIRNKQIYRSDIICQKYSEPEERNILGQMYLKLKNMLKNLI